MSFPQLTVASVFIVVSLVISRRFALGLGGAMAVGALRAGAQLLAIGYFLSFLFARQSPAAVAAVIGVMLATAAFTSVQRIENAPPVRLLVGYALFAIVCGAATALVPFFLFIVRPQPWFDARVVIPLAGMMLSSAMNVVALVLERIFALSRAEAAQIEILLALGATPRQALAAQTRAALRASLMPTINALATVGLVALPGMMTGQILSGASPEQAVRYQIVIMYQLVAVAAVSGSVTALVARRLIFNARDQLAVWTGNRG